MRRQVWTAISKRLLVIERQLDELFVGEGAISCSREPYVQRHYVYVSFCSTNLNAALFLNALFSADRKISLCARVLT